MLIKDLMTRDVITVSPGTPLKEVGRLLKEKRISGIPVLDDAGKIVGIVTITDILMIIRAVYDFQENRRNATGLSVNELVGTALLNKKVSEVMKRDVCTLDEDKSLHDVMKLMFTEKIHTIPITKDGKLVGVIGKRDLVLFAFSVI